MKKCVIFDCDGTLVDSESLCCQALVNVFSGLGAQLSMEDCLAQFRGGKLADILSNARNFLGVKISLDVLEPLYREELKALFEQQLQPMPGAVDLLGKLQDAGIEYCVTSNAPQEKIETSLGLTGLLPLFQGRIFSAFDANAWKPEPDLILYCAMNMGFSPSECIYVDDTAKGAEAGLRAEVETYQLCNGNLPKAVTDKSIDKINSLRELESILAI